jgi:hypothetical protein
LAAPSVDERSDAAIQPSPGPFLHCFASPAVTEKLKAVAF